MIHILLTAFTWAQPLCSNIQPTHTDYSKLQKKIETKLVRASNLMTIASEADAVLSKLLRAKSPVIINWIEKRKLMSAQEEEIAKQWRQYYLENFVLSEFPTKNIKINASVESVFQEVNNLAFSEGDKLKFEKLLEDAKAYSAKVVQSWKLNPITEVEILSRINAIDLYWFQRIQGSPYESKPLEFLKWGIAYDPLPNKINIGIEAKQYPNDETLFSVLAHEIGHSIDSCRWSAFMKTQNPFEKLHQCLRQVTGAKKRDDSKMEEALSKKLLTPAMALSLKQHPTCNRSFYPPPGSQKEQILETFADWFSAEVVAISSYNNEKIRNDLCAIKKLMPGSSYLTNQSRLSKIYWAHPKIGKDTKAKATYCKL